MNIELNKEEIMAEEEIKQEPVDAEAVGEVIKEFQDEKKAAEKPEFVPTKTLCSPA